MLLTELPILSDTYLLEKRNIKTAYSSDPISCGIVRRKKSYDVDLANSRNSGPLISIFKVPDPREDYAARFEWLHDEVMWKFEGLFLREETRDIIVPFAVETILTDSFFRL